MIIDGKRSLAHVERISWVKPIEGADNIELIGVLGWTCIAKIGEFKENDLCVYIEIDSKVPEKEWSEFLRRKHFKIKTMKLSKFNVISQGLALPIDMFDIEIPQKEGSDVTELLEIKYSNPADAKRKSDGPDKYEVMAQHHKKLFKKSWIKWLMKREWGKKLLFALFGPGVLAILTRPLHTQRAENTEGVNQSSCKEMERKADPWAPFSPGRHKHRAISVACLPGQAAPNWP